MPVISRALAALFSPIVWLAGCGGGPPALGGGRTTPAEDVRSPDRRDGMTEEPERAPTLTPGDVLTVRTVSAQTETYEGVTVDETGRIHLPLAGDIAVGGLSLAEAEQRVQEAFRVYDRVARAALTISSSGGRTITVLGAVVTPGRVPLTTGVRLADAIALAGGPRTHVSEEGATTAIADLAEAVVHRGGRILPVRVDYALEGRPRHNIRMRPGDLVFVPATGTAEVTVIGSVRSPRQVRFRPGMRLTDAIADAGGVSLEGDASEVRIMRGRDPRRRIYGANLPEVVEGTSADPTLLAGDVVFVAEEETVGIGETLERIGPLLTVVTSVGLAVTLVYLAR